MRAPFHRANEFSLCAYGLLLLMSSAVATAAAKSHSFDIPAGSLYQSLCAFSLQSDLQILFDSDAVAGVTVQSIRGDLRAPDALSTMLSGTALVYEFVNARTVVISPHANGQVRAGAIKLAQQTEGTPSEAAGRGLFHVAQSADSGPAVVRDEPRNERSGVQSDQHRPTMPEILIKGSRSINTDIRRTEDDIQPYVVLDREQIARSEAVNLAGFLKSALPMNTAATTTEQLANEPASIWGNINLRGLGQRQTLILVDGRRLPGTTLAGGSLNQPDISGIPLSSIERIEVLPATAGAIYGGGATGGVINIIRKHDYQGFDLQARYANTFESDVSSVEISANGGMSLLNGRTHVSFSASHAESKPLLAAERDFGLRARERLLQNVPYAERAPPTGRLSNLCTSYPGEAICSSHWQYVGYPEYPELPLTLDSGQTLTVGSTSVPAGYSGPAGDNGAVFIGDANGYDLEVPASGAFLLRAPETKSVSLGLRHEIASAIEGFVDISGMRSDSDMTTAAPSTIVDLAGDDPRNPFQEDIRVKVATPSLHLPGYSQTEFLLATGGLIARLPREWAVTLEHSWSRNRSESKLAQTQAISDAGFEAIADAALSDLAFLDLSAFDVTPVVAAFGPYDSILNATTLRFSGPTMRLPAGPVQLSGLLERRRERLDSGFQEDPTRLDIGLDPVIRNPERSQTVNSYYLEANWPLIGQSHAIPLVRTLELQTAIRYDDYSIRSTQDKPSALTREGPFAQANYTMSHPSSDGYLMGLRWVLAPAVTARASFGTGFLPPALSQLVSVTDIWTLDIDSDVENPRDPLRPGTRASVPRIQIDGGSPDLRPEDSESFSAGMIFTPRFAENLRFSIDYTRIRKSGEAFSPSLRFVIENEASFPGRVIRGPNLPDDQPGWAGPITSIDRTYINLSDTTVKAFDFQVDYTWSAQQIGTWRFAALATRMDEFERKIVPNSEAFELTGYSDGPLQWKANATVSWERGSWLAQWSTQYFDSYFVAEVTPGLDLDNEENLLEQGASTIPSQVYHDLLVRYAVPSTRSSWLSGIRLAAGVQNLFDTSPPILSTSGIESWGVGTYSAYGDPRRRRFSLTVQKSF